MNVLYPLLVGMAVLSGAFLAVGTLCYCINVVINWCDSKRWKRIFATTYISAAFVALAYILGSAVLGGG